MVAPMLQPVPAPELPAEALSPIWSQQPPLAPSTSRFTSILDLQPEEPRSLISDPTEKPPSVVQATQPPPASINIWRRRLQAQGLEADLTKERLKKVLGTLMLWVSWIHEDVGHAMAAFVYDPVHTPLFVPADGVGIPIVPLAFMVGVHRFFVFVERPKLVDAPPDHWFTKKTCKKHMFLFTKCERVADDKKCFTTMQAGLQALALDREFQQCGRNGFYSCMDSVETSASS